MSEASRELFTPVLKEHLNDFSSSNVIFVGKVKSNDGRTLTLTDSNEDEVSITDFNGDSNITGFVEIRGVSSSDSSIEFKDITQYNSDFNLNQYEDMLKYGHKMNKDCLLP
ncbi:unnamed protein product [Moneuplotes crassus]|uniref:Replication factor A protein 3 n=1 Tax=Euplotes crassus TaxID=5936 RepID=A0AAD1Y1Q2_EUPCR|nr:unnamed protein product [Moneuplotes crassus]